MAYSLITALILTIFVKYNKVFIFSVVSFALLDGIGVFVYYNIELKNTFVIIGSIYYALYTIFIIISLGMFRNLEYTQDTKLNKEINKAIQENDVMQLSNEVNNILNNTNKYLSLDEKVIQSYYKDKLSQTKIAKKLNISQPKVSRIIKKYNEEK